MLRCLPARYGASLPEWDLLIRQARRAGLLARMAIAIEELGWLDAVPPQPRLHFEAERRLADKHDRDVRREVRHIEAALAGTGAPIILLKGAAYVIGGLPPSRGRLFNDIDIMVPKDSLGDVEAALERAGWRSTGLDAYDERYYRRWMHQIPPMTHLIRGSTIDVHHSIVARTMRLGLDAETLLAAAVPVPGEPGLKTLAPPDMILHSAAHLLNGGVFERGLRDLDDLNLLLRHFGRDPAFWPTLLDRAEALDLRRPLFYALRYTARFLGTPVPDGLCDAARLASPGAAVRTGMDVLFERALRPDHPSCRDGWTGLALWLLYVRAHHLLMPPHILVPHLLRKSIVRMHREEEDTRAAQRRLDRGQ